MAAPVGLPIKNKLEDMQVGDCIPCRYIATNTGVAGYFSELGTCVASEIPLDGSATPDGLFYFNKVANGLLVSDRVVQHSISWDALNGARYIDGRMFSNSIVPIITSNTAPTPYVVTFNHQYDAVYSGYTTFDGIIGTTSNGWSSLGGSGTPWLQINFGKLIRDISRIDFLIRDNHTLTIQKSEDGVTFTNIVSNYTMIGNSTTFTSVVFDPLNAQYIKIIVNGSNYNSGQGYITECRIYSNSINYYVIRSLSGGNAYLGADGKASLTDKGLGGWPTNNEWDKYVVKSDLGGKITAGDDNVWHWNQVMWNWCVDTSMINLECWGTYGSNANRVIRGYHSGAPQYGLVKALAHYSSNPVSPRYTGFRPVLEYIEPGSKQTNTWY